MERLIAVNNLISKYGISLHKFGPYISNTDNKFGICLDIKDDKYGYLTRNFVFDSLDDFENFLKKYSYYKNVLKCNSRLSLNNYLDSTPNIKYGFDERYLIDEQNLQIEIDAIKNSSSKLREYLDSIYKNRLDKLKAHDLAFKNMNDSLEQYKKNLHTFYQKQYDELLTIETKNTLDNYKIKLENTLSQIQDKSFDVRNAKSIEEAKKEIKILVDIIKEFDIDQEYFEFLYDLYLYKNKNYLLNKMNECILIELDKQFRITPQELKVKLEDIKANINFNNTKESFVKDKIDEISQKYKDLEGVEEFNIVNALKGEKFINLQHMEFVDKKDDNDYSHVVNIYNNLIENQKKDLLILFSPFKPIINKVLTINSYDINDYKEYESLYEEMLYYLNIPDNLIFKKKHFSSVDFSNFESFIYSLFNVSKNLSNIDFRMNSENYVWAYPSSMSLIYASFEVLKSKESIINCYKLNINSSILYSAKKIVITNDHFMLDVNSSLFIKQDKNVIKSINKTDIIKDFKPILDKKFKMEVVSKMVEKASYTYNNYNVEGVISG